VEVERICATSGGPERADVENLDHQGRQDEEDVEKTQGVLDCPHALRITSGRRRGLARSGAREDAESKEERSSSWGREKDEL